LYGIFCVETGEGEGRIGNTRGIENYVMMRKTVDASSI